MNKKINLTVLLLTLLVAATAIAFFAGHLLQNNKPVGSPQPSISPTSTPILTPQPTPSQSPISPSSTASPAISASNSPSISYLPSTSPSQPISTIPASTPPPPVFPDLPIQTMPPVTLYPGEVTQYQGQNLSPAASVYENAIAGTQHIDPATYTLSIFGLVNKTVQMSYNQTITNHRLYQKVVTINCVEGWSATILWEGVLVKDLIQDAGPLRTANTIIFHASDGYTTSLPLDYITNSSIILAYKMNGLVLPPERGFPFMLVAESKYGYKWIKWVTGIELSNDPNYLGYWESRGYSNDATVP